MQKRTIQNGNVPQIIEGHVLVKVHKASINPIDFSNRSGYLQQYIPLQFPITLGSSFSGIVAEIGEGTKGFKIGDKVFGSGSQLNGGTGTLAEYVVVPAGFLAHQPSYINDDIAAIIPSSALTAYIALFENGELKAGNKVLIHGGAGGVGSVGIQLAKSANTYVATTVSKNDFGIAKELGADEIIEYKNKAFENVIKNYDVVFDTVGGDTYKKSFEVLKENGSVISVVEQPNTELMSAFNVKAKFVMGMATTERLNKFTKVFEEKNLKIKEGKKFSIEQVKEAFEFQQNGHPKGKTIIEIN